MRCLDLAVEALDEAAVRSAELVAFHVPMHTATRLAVPIAERARTLNPSAHLCFYGLYAPLNEAYLRRLGADSILGGEFESGMLAVARRLRAGRGAGPQTEPVISTGRQRFEVPSRGHLPPVSRYAHLHEPDGGIRIVGYTEATRGCRHLCRHCPIVPVYGGRFRVVPRNVVLEDIATQVRAGATHVTFGDPDFFNGPGHALPIVRELHERWPHVTYDVTIKIEHLLRSAEHLSTLRETGCAFVTSAVESADDRVLEIFDKRHTRQDFVAAAAAMRSAGLALVPTFVTFTPWTTRQSYLDLLGVVSELALVDNVPPVQWAIRLLIPAGSRLLELPEVREHVDDFDERALCYQWRHPDRTVDQLYEQVREIARDGLAARLDRREIFGQVWAAAGGSAAAGASAAAAPRATVPYLNEPWYC